MRTRLYASCMINYNRNPTLIHTLEHESQPWEHHRRFSTILSVSAQLQYIMIQGTFRARISCALDHMHPAWSTANKVRPWYVPWIMSYNLCSINVWPRAFRCWKFILYLLLPLLLLPAATGSCHYLSLYCLLYPSTNSFSACCCLLHTTLHVYLIAYWCVWPFAYKITF